MTDGTGKETPAHEADIYAFTPPPPTPEELAGAASLRLARRRRRLRRTAAGLAVVLGGGTGTAVAVLASGSTGQTPQLASASVTTTTSGPSAPKTSGTGPASTGPASTTPLRPFGRRGPWDRPRALGPLGAAVVGGNVVHGTYTVKTSSGGYETVEVQAGTATSVTSGSIEVTSADGYAQSYQVSASTLVDAGSMGISAIKKGDKVLVQATLSGSSTVAQRVVDLTEVRGQWAGGPFGAGPGPLPGGPSPAA